MALDQSERQRRLARAPQIDIPTLDADPALRAALPSLSDCPPEEFRDNVVQLLSEQTATPGLGRWALRLATDLAPLLDWKTVLAHLRIAVRP